jgi:multidrug efflux pump subunit AcrA (membrane-fusion protein)
MTNPANGDFEAPHPLLAPPRRHRGRTVFWVALGVVVVGGVAVWQVLAHRPATTETAAEQTLNTAVIRTQDLTDTTTLDGTLEFENPVDAASPGAGYVVTVAGEGEVLQRGDVIAMVAEDVTDDQVLAAQQHVLSAKSSLTNAQEQYSNTVAPPSDADLAAAQVAVTKATDAYNALFDPPSDADLAAARAALERAQDAYSALLSGPDESQVANAQLALQKAAATLDQAATANQLALVDLQSAQSAYCSMASVPVDVCSTGDIPLTGSARSALVTAIDDFTSGGDPASAATTRALLDADTAYRNTLVSYDSALSAQQSASDTYASLQDGPTQAQIDQALADLYSAQDRMDALQSVPTDAEIAAAKADKMAAEERLANLQAGASSASRSSASASVQNAKINLQLAQQDLAALVSGPKVVVLFYGPLHSWRTLSDGVSPGPDVLQLETNLLALGFDADGTLVADDTFDEATTKAVIAWQESLGVDATGVVDLGTIQYVDGPSQVTSALSTIGDAVGANTPVAELTPIEQVVDHVSGTLASTDGTTAEATASEVSSQPEGANTASNAVQSTVETTQRVTSQVDVSDRGILAVGMPVTVTLPDDTEIDATVESIGDVAITQTGQGGSTTSVVDVVFTPTQSVDAVWTGADVTIDVVTSLTKNALTVPVTALLALREGGYAVQVVNADGSTTLVGVTTGSFNNGYVEITGDGLSAGMDVVVP